MSNLANYSPYNKTFKFVLFQNQAYHEKNKRLAKPCVRTNIRYARPSTSPFQSNPEHSPLLKEFFDSPSPLTKSLKRCDSPDPQISKSMLVPNEGLKLTKIDFEKPRRVIHKHQSFEKFRGKKVEMENRSLVKRIINTSCEVVRK